MKKNRMMRAASALLVAVLLTTCTISGTFAKYVTEVNASDNARVAAWGFGTTSKIEFDLFDSSYNDTVTASNSDNLIAPGTTKTTKVKLNYAGTVGKPAPEVDYTIDLDVDLANTSIDDGINGNPNIDWFFNGVWFDSWAAMLTAIDGYHEDVQANALPTIANTGIEIGWNWKFSTDATMDSYDTAMGDANPLDTVKLTINLTATQVD